MRSIKREKKAEERGEGRRGEEGEGLANNYMFFASFLTQWYM